MGRRAGRTRAAADRHRAGFLGRLAVRAFSQADQRDELAAVDVPTLVIHGDADASAPLELCARPTADGIADARLVVYPGGPHGLPLCTEHAERLTGDLLAFAGDGPR